MEKINLYTTVHYADVHVSDIAPVQHADPQNTPSLNRDHHTTNKRPPPDSLFTVPETFDDDFDQQDPDTDPDSGITDPQMPLVTTIVQNKHVENADDIIFTDTGGPILRYSKHIKPINFIVLGEAIREREIAHQPLTHNVHTNVDVHGPMVTVNVLTHVYPLTKVQHKQKGSKDTKEEPFLLIEKGVNHPPPPTGDHDLLVRSNMVTTGARNNLSRGQTFSRRLPLSNTLKCVGYATDTTHLIVIENDHPAVGDNGVGHSNFELPVDIVLQGSHGDSDSRVVHNKFPHEKPDTDHQGPSTMRKFVLKETSERPVKPIKGMVANPNIIEKAVGHEIAASTDHELASQSALRPLKKSAGDESNPASARPTPRIFVDAPVTHNMSILEQHQDHNPKAADFHMPHGSPVQQNNVRGGENNEEHNQKDPLPDPKCPVRPSRRCHVPCKCPSRG